MNYIVRSLSFESRENEKNFHCFASFHSDCWKIPFEIDLHASIEWLVWALIIWSFVFRIVVPICEVGSGREILTSCGGVSPRSIISVLLISSLEVFASNPLFWSMACSSFFVVILSKRDFFLESSFVFDSFQFFVPYLSAAPTWGMSVVAKLCCVLSSFLVAVYYSRISFYSINSLFLEHRSLVFHLLSQRSYLGFCLFFIVQKVRRDLERHDPLIL